MLDKIKRFFGDWENQSRYMKWLIRYSKPYIPQLILIMLLGIATTFASIGLSLIGKEMIDKASGGGEVMNTVLLYVLVVLISQVFSVISTLVVVIVNEKFAFGIRKQVYTKVLDTNWLEIMKYHTGDLMTRLTSDVGIVAEGISSTIPAIIRLSIELVATFCTLAYFDWRLACASLVIAPIAAISSLWLGKRLKLLQIKVQESESKYRSFVQESLANILIVKSFCAEEYSENRLTALRDERLHWMLKKSRMGLVASTVMGLTFQFGYIAAFAWGSICISRGEITFGTMSVFLTLVNRVQGPIIALAEYIPKIVAVLASSGRIIDLQKLPEEEKQTENIRPEGIGVKVEQLSFGYTEELVLKDANIEFRPGEFTAIVGESGVGKTTLIRLIMAFTNTAMGSIQFYNSLGECEPANAKAREFIAYVPQGNTLFSGSIRENIRMGKLDATEEEMYEALRGAAAYNFVMSLPKGLDTVIGEKGHGLSEGQAQRIAIARALVRKAPFLILDEATSSLDEETELRVLEGIRNWTPAPTCLLITHRRSVLQYCDREIQIQNRELKELK
ncbi:MAG: ABC transporter ATP-binding protein [Lachnospiraceae bacterium]|nr:ABC transporter ATP-binding protein [Lachnospiraceae bacterium]